MSIHVAASHIVATARRRDVAIYDITTAEERRAMSLAGILHNDAAQREAWRSASAMEAHGWEPAEVADAHRRIAADIGAAAAARRITR